jgi:dTDP-4-amino-4,6-dideoxygalactose transaminase
MSSGTTALSAAFFACDFKPGDEVIVPAYTYHATASPLLHFPVDITFCDVESDTGNLSPTALAEALSERTAAVVTNHQWGHPVNVDAIRSIIHGAQRQVRWIEDCSHAHYAEYRGRRVGQFGDVAVFSLQGNKLVPAGEGGVLITNDLEIHDRASVYAYSLERTEHCLLLDRYKPLARTGLGLKHRIHPLGALIALHFIEKRVAHWIRSRGKLLAQLTAGLVGVQGIQPPTTAPYVTSRGAFYGYKPLFLSDAFENALTRSQFVERLVAAGLNVKVPGSYQLYRLPLFVDSPVELPAAVQPVPVRGLAGTERYCSSIISVPTFTEPQEAPLVDYYVDAFRWVAEHARQELLAQCG